MRREHRHGEGLEVKRKPAKLLSEVRGCSLETVAECFFEKGGLRRTGALPAGRPEQTRIVYRSVGLQRCRARYV